MHIHVFAVSQLFTGLVVPGPSSRQQFEQAVGPKKFPEQVANFDACLRPLPFGSNFGALGVASKAMGEDGNRIFPPDYLGPEPPYGLYAPCCWRRLPEVPEMPEMSGIPGEGAAEAGEARSSTSVFGENVAANAVGVPGEGVVAQNVGIPGEGVAANKTGIPGEGVAAEVAALPSQEAVANVTRWRRQNAINTANRTDLESLGMQMKSMKAFQERRWIEMFTGLDDKIERIEQMMTREGRWGQRFEVADRRLEELEMHLNLVQRQAGIFRNEMLNRDRARAVLREDVDALQGEFAQLQPLLARWQQVVDSLPAIPGEGAGQDQADAAQDEAWERPPGEQ